MFHKVAISVMNGVETKALLQSGIAPRLNYSYLQHFFKFLQHFIEISSTFTESFSTFYWNFFNILLKPTHITHKRKFIQSGISKTRAEATGFCFSLVFVFPCGLTISTDDELTSLLLVSTTTVSENLYAIFPYSLRKGMASNKNSQKSFRIPNHPKEKLEKS